MGKIPTTLNRSQAQYVRDGVEAFLKAHHVPLPSPMLLEQFQLALRRPDQSHALALPVNDHALSTIVMLRVHDEWDFSVARHVLFTDVDMTESLVAFITGMLEQHEEQFAEGLIDAWEYIHGMSTRAIFDRRQIQIIQTRHNDQHRAPNGAHRAGRNAAYVKLAEYCHTGQYDRDELLLVFFRIVMRYAIILQPPKGSSE